MVKSNTNRGIANFCIGGGFYRIAIEIFNLLHVWALIICRWMDNVIVTGSHLFGGGFLGMDNISCVERSNPPEGTHVAQVSFVKLGHVFKLCLL